MLFNCSVCTFFENRHKDGEKWGKMGKEFYGDSNFPHFSPLKKTSKDVQFSLKWLRYVIQL